MHPLYTLLLNSPVSPLNEPIKAILPLDELLMLIAPFEDEEDDVAAIWGSTVGILQAIYIDNE